MDTTVSWLATMLSLGIAITKGSLFGFWWGVYYFFFWPYQYGLHLGDLLR